MTPSERGKEKIGAAKMSIFSNTLLVLLKLTVGILSGSVSVLSEAAHSATDLLASWIAFFSVRVSDRPADADHPYGHGKIESISGMAEAILIFGAAGYIIIEAIRKLITHKAAPDVDLGMVVMGISVITNILVAQYLYRIARKTDSLALKADAEHLRTDVYTSLGVVFGLALVRITKLAWLDPATAILVATLILHAAWRLTRGALAPLMDARLPVDEVELIMQNLREDPRVYAFHKLRTRKSGSTRQIDAHVLLDDNLSLLQAHQLTEELEDKIRQKLPNVEITLHTEPFQEEMRHQYLYHGGPPPEETKLEKEKRQKKIRDDTNH
jgi:cation diffusion facilitator family transporter